MPRIACKASTIGLSLTLADLGGVGESVFDAAPNMPRNFYAVSAPPGHARNLMIPDFSAHGSNGIRDGRALLQM
jgi:hypothetical protein